MQEKDLIRANIQIQGRVQGVGYRAWAEQEARARSLQGWVKNRDDGTVEAVLEGPKTVIEDMLNACRRGPTMASVTDLQVDFAQATGEFHIFRVSQ